MEKTKTPKQIIQSYLEERAKNDPLFANVYAKPNKNINECFDYILSEAKKRGNAVCMSVLKFAELPLKLGFLFNNCCTMGRNSCPGK